MIVGKYSALKGIALGVIVLILILDLIFTCTYTGGISVFFKYFNMVFALGFGIGLIQTLYNKWKEKDETPQA